MAYFDHHQYYKDDIPEIAHTEYRVTSEETTAYNCIAWALEIPDQWIDPTPDYIWHEEVERGYTVAVFMELFTRWGRYESCDNGSLEEGYQKIAIYHDGFNQFHHVARQLASGKWTSKLGSNEDIEHELSGLEGKFYGYAKIFMKRPVSV